MTTNQKEKFISLFLFKIPYNMIIGKIYLSILKNKDKSKLHYEKCIEYLKILIYHNGDLDNADKESIKNLIDLISLSIDNKELEFPSISE
ncbi:MAG: hypothetical protein PHC28_14995 [Flavobacterium sp.]|uniref:hypothetical protein n=1 Tax=Flavobacterium sp. TaxID=239 RepID=UPI002609107E|nr:hypothetical protein [Flavobacterium sp.]MDD5151760.1 hypothetical protein [Flavobacterium sp.]